MSAFARRLFRLGAAGERWVVYVDTISDDKNHLGKVLNTRHWTAKDSDDVERNFDDLQRHRSVPRIRTAGSNRDPLQPDADDTSVVELHAGKGGKVFAYWRLPNNLEENAIIGTNQYQNTFRNAIECLFENHIQYVVDWEIFDSTGWETSESAARGRLVLAAEAPSKTLWEQTVRLAKAGTRVRVRLTIVEDKENQKKKRMSLIIPGANNVVQLPVPADSDDLQVPTPGVFQAIRTALQDRTRPRQTPIRVWPGPENYTKSNDSGDVRHHVLNAQANGEDGDRASWLISALPYTKDGIVARPEFGGFDVIDALDNKRTARWNKPQATENLEWTKLSTFRRVLKSQTLWPNYKIGDYFAIIQPLSNDTFVIGPEMTEEQWRYQVFDWFDAPMIYVRMNFGAGLGIQSTPASVEVGDSTNILCRV